jgi:hypothetical protein
MHCRTLFSLSLRSPWHQRFNEQLVQNVERRTPARKAYCEFVLFHVQS